MRACPPSPRGPRTACAKRLAASSSSLPCQRHDDALSSSFVLATAPGAQRRICDSTCWRHSFRGWPGSESTCASPMLWASAPVTIPPVRAKRLAWANPILRTRKGASCDGIRPSPASGTPSFAFVATIATSDTQAIPIPPPSTHALQHGHDHERRPTRAAPAVPRTCG